MKIGRVRVEQIKQSYSDVWNMDLRISLRIIMRTEYMRFRLMIIGATLL